MLKNKRISDKKKKMQKLMNINTFFSPPSHCQNNVAGRNYLSASLPNCMMQKLPDFFLSFFSFSPAYLLEHSNNRSVGKMANASQFSRNINSITRRQFLFFQITFWNSRLHVNVKLGGFQFFFPLGMSGLVKITTRVAIFRKL